MLSSVPLLAFRSASSENARFRPARFNWYRDGSDWKPFHHDSAAFNPRRAASQNITVGPGERRKMRGEGEEEGEGEGEGREGGNEKGRD